MSHQHQHFVMRLLVVGAFVFSGAAVYWFAHWLIFSDSPYSGVIWFRSRIVGLLAGVLLYLGLWWSLGTGLLLGLSVVAVQAKRWLLLPLGLLLLTFAVFIVFILIGFL